MNHAAAPAGQRSPLNLLVRRLLRENGLTLALLGLFAASWAGQIATGHRAYNNERKDARQPPVTLGEYLSTGHFVEATAENWESEFLQMGAFVWLTSFLYQRGSPESKDPRGEDPEPPVTDQSPWPARRGGWVAAVYGQSLALTLLFMFLVSFVAHAAGGRVEYNEQQARLGQEPVTLAGFLGTSEFWFQSFQNWQSEFLSIAVMVVLGIWLRQRGSKESKPVNAPHDANE
jgi:hypothetical protein